jgi:hypothetical protein
MHITLGTLLACAALVGVCAVVYAMRARRLSTPTIYLPAHSLPYVGSLFSLAKNFDRFP